MGRSGHRSVSETSVCLDLYIYIPYGSMATVWEGTNHSPNHTPVPLPKKVLYISGWWFGTCILWLSIYWEESFQLTFMFFRGLGIPPTSIYIYTYILDIVYRMNPLHLLGCLDVGSNSPPNMWHKWSLATCGCSIRNRYTPVIYIYIYIE